MLPREHSDVSEISEIFLLRRNMLGLECGLNPQRKGEAPLGTLATTLERTVGIEPTPPHWMCGALLSFVREGHTKYLIRRQVLAHRPRGTFYWHNKRAEAPSSLVPRPQR